jgi:hypothetical protein
MSTKHETTLQVFMCLLGHMLWPTERYGKRQRDQWSNVDKTQSTTTSWHYQGPLLVFTYIIREIITRTKESFKPTCLR